MITWNRLARDLAQMLTTCPLYPSLLCDSNRGYRSVEEVFSWLIICTDIYLLSSFNLVFLVKTFAPSNNLK